MIKKQNNQKIKNRLFIFLLLGIFLISFASALEFDNVKEYNSESNEVRIFNCDLWVGTCLIKGDEIGGARLTSPLSVKVPRGYQKVAEFDLWAKEDYNNILKEFSFKDRNNKDESIVRDYDLKKVDIVDIEVNDYLTECPAGYNPENYEVLEECEQILIGTHTEQKEKWTKITPADLKKDEFIRVGVFTDVQKGDHIDWIPKIYGVDVEEWAEWSEDLNVDLEFYGKLNDTTGDVLDSTGTENGTLRGTPTRGVTGKIGDAYYFSGSGDDSFNMTGATQDLGGGSFSVGGWYNWDTDGTDIMLFHQGDVITATHAIWLRKHSDNTIHFDVHGSSLNGVDTILAGNWYFIVMTYNVTDRRKEIYINGTRDATNIGNTIGSIDGYLEAGTDRGGKLYDGIMDEVFMYNRVLTSSEISDMWNSGDGITWTDVFGTGPSITLTSPTDTADLTSSNVEFIATVTDDIQVTNVSLYLDGILNQTNTSGFNGSYTFNQAVVEGIHIWSIGAYDNESLFTQSSNRTFNYTQPPIDIELNNPADAFVSTVPLINMSCSAMDPLGVEQLNLTINGIVNETLTNTSVAENITISKLISFNEGIYIWGCQALNTVNIAASSNRTLNVTYSFPEVNLILPEDNANTTEQQVNFIFNVTDENGIANVSLFINGVLNYTNSTGYTTDLCYQESTNTSNQSSTDGNCNLEYTGTYECGGNGTFNPGEPCDLAFDGNYSTRTGNFGSDDPVFIFMNYTKPKGATNESIWTVKIDDPGQFFNISLTESCWNQPSNVLLLYWEGHSGNPFGEGSHLGCINSTGGLELLRNGSSELWVLWEEGMFWDIEATKEQTYQIEVTLDEGFYNWSVSADSIFGGQTNSSNRSLIVHLTAPNATIIAPSGELGYFLLGSNETLTYSFLEPGQNLSEHLDECYYVYNGANETLNCTANSTEFIYLNGVNNISIFAIDTFGFSANTSSNWSYDILEINQTYINQTIEGSTQNISAIIRMAEGVTISSAILYYGISNSSGIVLASGENTELLKVNLVTPNRDTEGNSTFYWSITLSDDQVINLSEQSQFISVISLDNCSNFTNTILNISMVDEEEQTVITNNTIFEIAISFLSSDRTVTIFDFSQLFRDENPISICLSENITSGVAYSLDATIRYTATGYANEYYNIVNTEFTNETETINLTLYSLNETDSTEFQLSFTGSDFLPIENALVYVDRQYISENTFKTVELPKTDYNGQSVLHLVRNDVIYNIRITKDGVVLGNFENLVAFCDDFTIGDCNIELNAFDSVESVFNYVEDLDIIYTTPTYNETLNLVSFNFLTSDGLSKEVTLEVTRNDIFGNRSVCNATLFSPGGTLQCAIDPNLDDSVLGVSVYTEGVLTVKGNVALEDNNYGAAGYLIMFVMAIAFAFMFSGSKTGVLISMGLTLAGALGMGIVQGELIGSGASGIWLLIIIVIGIYKLNKDKAS